MRPRKHAILVADKDATPLPVKGLKTFRRAKLEQT